MAYLKKRLELDKNEIPHFELIEGRSEKVYKMNL